MQTVILLPGELRAFLQERGLPEENLATEPLEALEHDIADFNLVVCVNGSYKDYLTRVPFHTSALNWPVDGMQPEADRTAQYRSLRTLVDELLHLVAGEHLQRS